MMSSFLRSRIQHYLLLALLCTTAFASDTILLRSQLSTEHPWVGQQLTLTLTVLGRDGWAQISDLSKIEIPGCYVFTAGDNRTRVQETIRGNSYTGQQYNLSIYPQRSGTLHIPNTPLDITLRTWGTNSKAESHSAKIPPLQFHAKLPPATDPNLPLIVSTQFKATQNWKPDSHNFEIGQAIQRSIQLQAHELPAMVLPPLNHQAPSGIGSYPDSPQLNSQQQAGHRISTRSEQTTYVFERGGQHQLPDLQLQWWNPKTEQLEVITLPGRQLNITAPSSTPATSHPNPKSQNRLILLTACTLILLGILYGVHLQRHKQPSPKTLERTAFKRLQTTASKQQPIAFVNGLYEWLRYQQTPHNSPTDFINATTPTAQLNNLRSLLSDPQHSSANLHTIVKQLKTARKIHRRQQRQQRKANELLPPLNS